MLNAGQCSASWVHSMLNTQEGQAFQWHSIQQMLFHHSIAPPYVTLKDFMPHEV